MDQLEASLKQSLADDFLAKEEKKKLKDLFENRRLSKTEQERLTQLVFELAKTKITDGKSQFVLDWVRQTTLMIGQAGGSEKQDEAYFSPGETCRKAIIDQINSAVSKIKIAVFTISDDSIVSAIMAAHRKGRNIRILTDNDKSLDTGSDILQLQRSGVSVRMDTTPAHMHHKFMVTDDTRLLTGSYNWTSSAARVNYENVIVSSDEKLVASFLKEFERLWTGTAF